MLIHVLLHANVHIHFGDGARVGEGDIYAYCIHVHMHMHIHVLLHANIREVHTFPIVYGEGSCVRLGQGGGGLLRNAVGSKLSHN